MNTKAPERIWVHSTGSGNGGLYSTRDQSDTRPSIEYIRADLATPYPRAAFGGEDTQAQVRVKPLEWHKSHFHSWRDDWHTVPAAYTIRCADENGWKWAGQSVVGYSPTPEAAKAAAQADYAARILAAIEVTP